MKGFMLFLTLTLFFNLGLKSQNYVPFPTQNVNWNVYLLATCGEVPPDTILLRYTIHGDTTINKISYKKLCIESGDLQNPKIRSIGGLREENKKIYYNGAEILRGSSGEEILLYDFTKHIGDTIKHKANGRVYSVIEGIDSVLIYNSYRKRYKVDNHWFYNNPDYIIEGIGSVQNGLLGHISDIPTCGHHYWEHICFKENGIVKYLNPSFSECFPANLLTSINYLDKESEIKLYPNPLYSNLTVENVRNKDLRIRIFDTSGRLICERVLIDSKTIIELTMTKGVYNVSIVDKKGLIMTSKTIIKQ